MTTLLCTCVAALVASGTVAGPALAQHATPSSESGPRSDAQSAPARAPRDPFVRPTAEADGPPAQSGATPVPPPDGFAGLSTDQIAVRGVLTVDGRRVALAQGPDRKHYVIRPGDRLRDGVVQAVVPGGLVVGSDTRGPVGDGASRQPGKPALLPPGEGR